MDGREGSVGRTNFVDTYNLWTAEQREAANRALALIDEKGIELVRFSFPDQHGILRGKTLVAGETASVFRNGCALPVTLIGKDTSNKTIYPVFTADGGFGVEGMGGAGDLIMVPAPETFRILPWAPNTGWMLCDAYLKDGRPLPFSTRHICRQALDRLAAAGFDYAAGLEVEFYVMKLEGDRLEARNATQPPPPPGASLVAYGYHYLTEIRVDQLDPVIQLLLKNLKALGLPLRSFEGEFGPSQLEVTFDPVPGLEAADNMILFRNAVKQICRRAGYHATFMCRPGLPNFFASGWHLHQSLRDRKTGNNAFAPSTADSALSDVGLAFVAGVLKHARASCLFTTPTINGYKRYKPNSLAPDRALWGQDHKGAMLRVVNGGPGDPATRVENRVGEPAANPYLYLASQILTGLAGIEAGMKPRIASDTPYETEAEPLPASLMEAMQAFQADDFYHATLGRQFTDYILKIKQSEISRFLSEVTDWEHREYFEMF
ncbi:MAG: glutamine synthetase family protein [Hyphomicrobiaceae bacterium]